MNRAAAFTWLQRPLKSLPALMNWHWVLLLGGLLVGLVIGLASVSDTASARANSWQPTQYSQPASATNATQRLAEHQRWSSFKSRRSSSGNNAKGGNNTAEQPRKLIGLVQRVGERWALVLVAGNSQPIKVAQGDVLEDGWQVTEIHSGHIVLVSPEGELSELSLYQQPKPAG